MTLTKEQYEGIVIEKLAGYVDVTACPDQWAPDPEHLAWLDETLAIGNGHIRTAAPAMVEALSIDIDIARLTVVWWLQKREWEKTGELVE